MNNSDKINEYISAFVDGELDVALHETVLTSLIKPLAKAVWDEYHCIGQVLQFGKADRFVSKGFANRVLERLADEPVHLKSEEYSPALPPLYTLDDDGSIGKIRQFVVPGAAIAA